MSSWWKRRAASKKAERACESMLVSLSKFDSVAWAAEQLYGALCPQSAEKASLTYRMVEAVRAKVTHLHGKSAGRLAERRTMLGDSLEYFREARLMYEQLDEYIGNACKSLGFACTHFTQLAYRDSLQLEAATVRSQITVLEEFGDDGYDLPSEWVVRSLALLDKISNDVESMDPIEAFRLLGKADGLRDALAEELGPQVVARAESFLSDN